MLVEFLESHFMWVLALVQGKPRTQVVQELWGLLDGSQNRLVNGFLVGLARVRDLVDLERERENRALALTGKNLNKDII